MQLGVVGLGRMGANIVRRVQRHGHACVVYDAKPEAVRQLAGEGATGATGLDDLVAKLAGAARGLGDAAGGRDHRADGAGARGACSSPATW